MQKLKSYTDEIANIKKKNEKERQRLDEQDEICNSRLLLVNVLAQSDEFFTDRIRKQIVKLAEGIQATDEKSQIRKMKKQDDVESKDEVVDMYTPSVEDPSGDTVDEEVSQVDDEAKKKFFNTIVKDIDKEANNE